MINWEFVQDRILKRRICLPEYEWECQDEQVYAELRGWA